MDNTIPQNTPKRQCKECGDEHPLTPEFFPQGKGHICKTCANARERAYRAEHREARRAQSKAFYARNTEKVRADNKAYRLANPEKVKAQKRADYVKHHDEIRAKQNADRKANPEKRKAQKHASYLRTREHVLIQTRAYRLSHPEDDARRHRDWKRTHRETHSKQRREYAEANREYIREWQRNYNVTHREQHRAAWHRRRARILQAGGSYTSEQIQEQYQRQKGKCYYCQQKLGKHFHRDHAVPITRGGSNDISNIVLTCPRCNLQKRNRLPHEFFEGGRLM